MNNEFTIEEIREAIAIARIYSPGLTEEQFEGAIELGKRLGESGYLEVIHAVARFERERNISCTEVLDACEHLLREKVELEQRVGDFEARLGTVKSDIRDAEDKQREVEEATERGKGELQTVQTEHQKEEKELAAFRKKAEREKKRIDKEVEEYRQKANATKEEAAIASQIKAQVESYGFSLELALGLSREFAKYEDSRDELAKGLGKYGKLTKYIKALESDLNKLQSRRDEEQTKIDSLEQRRHQLENTVSQLQADVAHEEKLRGFYHRYQGVSPLMDYLASWTQLSPVFFVRCNNPVFAVTGAFSRAAGNAHFWVDKPPTRCPHCGCASNLLVYDEKPYQALGLPVGAPVTLQLGE